jgi:ubiquinone/menaquinone biosynthesis C-methylase UbiE
MTPPQRKRERAVWELYDPSAAAYHRYAAPGCFTDAARDLVGAVALSRGDRVLDVGSGTGVVAAAACERVLPDGCVVAVDLSAAMLAFGPAECNAIVGELPGLPVRAGCFDAACASFVLSHIDDYVGALRDMRRVVCAGGRVGVTAWTNKTNDYEALWGEVAGRFVDVEAMMQAAEQSRRCQEWLGHADNLRAALVEAGLEDVAVETRDYATDLTLHDYLEFKALLLSGRYIRHHTSEEDWRQFRVELEREFGARHYDRVRFNHPAHVAVGRSGG